MDIYEDLPFGGIRVKIGILSKDFHQAVLEERWILTFSLCYFSDFVIINRLNNTPFHPFCEAGYHVVLVFDPATSLPLPLMFEPSTSLRVLVRDCIPSCKVDYMSLIWGCHFIGMCPGCPKDPAFLFKRAAVEGGPMGPPE